MTNACQAFRESWIEAVLSGDGAALHEARSHREECSACRVWCARLSLQVRALHRLLPLTPPAALDEAVAAAWKAGPEWALVGLLRSCATLDVPEELPRRLAEEAFVAPFLRAMTPAPVPAVLERLIAEELKDPARARAERFPGDLRRLDVPPSLTDRLRRGRGLRGRRTLAPWIAALAAAFLLWIGLRPREGAGVSEPHYSFRVRYASAADQDPLAIELGAALGGGGMYAIEGVPDPANSPEGGGAFR